MDDLESEGQEAEYSLANEIAGGDFVAEIMAVVKQHVEEFFQNHSYHCGGPIPRRMLFTPSRLTLVVNTRLSDAVEIAYKFLEKTIDPEELERAEKSGAVTDDIKLVIKTLDLLSSSGVPKCLAGGIMLLYLECCEGVRFS